MAKEERSMINDLLFSGKRIAAIKEYRSILKVGLKEAKEAVDAIIRELQLRELYPPVFK